MRGISKWETADNSGWKEIGPRLVLPPFRPDDTPIKPVGADFFHPRYVLLGEKSTPVEKISGSSRGWGYGGGGTHRGG